MHRKALFMFAALLGYVVFSAAPVQALHVTADGTTLFQDNFEQYTLGATPKFAQQGDYDNFEGTAIVQNAAPPAYEGSQYMYLIRQPELNMRANFRDTGGNIVSATAGQRLHATIAVYADTSAGNSAAPLNIQVLNNSANLVFAFLSDPSGMVNLYRDGLGVISGTVPWVPNQWQVWDFDTVIGSTSLDLTIDGNSQTFDFTGFASPSLNAIRFTGRTAANDRYGIDAVPEPSSLLLLACGGLVVVRRRGSR